MPHQQPHESVAKLIDACVHCGFCLPTCPTYLLWGEEMDTPRGRIYLMKAEQDGRTPLSPDFVQHVDACLGCMACVTACPSGVQYGALIEQERAHIETHFARPFVDRLFRRMLLSVLPFPARLRLVLLPLALFGRPIEALVQRGLFNWLPARWRSLVSLAPTPTLAGLFTRIPERTAASGPVRRTVGVVTGCVQRLVFPEVNQATVRVLAAEGCDVLVPRGQPCCGALALHAGNVEEARARARQTIAGWEQRGAESIVVNAAGCGSAMKEYGDLLAGDSTWAARAAAFAARVRDVSEVLVELGAPRAPRNPMKLRAVYHDACHLAHAQQIRSQPRAVLATIPELEVFTPSEHDICCGSAGIYNLVQPGPAAALGQRKVRNIATLHPEIVAAANPGCILQLRAAARALGFTWTVVHPIELLDASIRHEHLHGMGSEL